LRPQESPADDRRVRCRRREWLAGQLLPPDERDTIDAALRQIDFLTEEIQTIDYDLAEFVLASPGRPPGRAATLAVGITAGGTGWGGREGCPGA
jgi:hypothetical protein